MTRQVKILLLSLEVIIGSTLGMAVMPACGCGQHGWWDRLNSWGPFAVFSQGRWWQWRLRLSDWLITVERRHMDRLQELRR